MSIGSNNPSLLSQLSIASDEIDLGESESSYWVLVIMISCPSIFQLQGQECEESEYTSVVKTSTYEILSMFACIWLHTETHTLKAFGQE